MVAGSRSATLASPETVHNHTAAPCTLPRSLQVPSNHRSFRPTKRKATEAPYSSTTMPTSPSSTHISSPIVPKQVPVHCTSISDRRARSFAQTSPATSPSRVEPSLLDTLRHLNSLTVPFAVIRPSQVEAWRSCSKQHRIFWHVSLKVSSRAHLSLSLSLSLSHSLSLSFSISYYGSLLNHHQHSDSRQLCNFDRRCNTGEWFRRIYDGQLYSPCQFCVKW